MTEPAHVIVTGGAGFIGSRIALRLLADGHRVTVLDDLSLGKRSNVPEAATFLQLDLGDADAYACLDGLRPVDAVFHLAGQSSGEASFDDPAADLRSHVLSTFNMLEWCRMHGVGRLLYASSMATYGDPEREPVDEATPQRPKTYYAAAKIGAEAYCRLFDTLGVRTTVFRLFSVYGPGQDLENMKQGMVSIFLAYLLAGEPILVKGSLERYRDFVFVEDVADAWLAAWYAEATFGRTYNLASGRRTTVRELVDALREAAGAPEHPVVVEGTTPGDQFGVVGDASAIQGDLGWTARTALVDGLRQMIGHERGTHDG